MKRFGLVLLTAMLAFSSGQVFADDDDDDDDDRDYKRKHHYDKDYYKRDRRGHNNGRGYGYGNGRGYETVDYADVISVDPIVRRGEERRRQECWNEPVSYRRDDDRYNRGNDRDRRNVGSGIIGGIIGGALGNQVGNGDGKKAATVAGAVVGYQIGKAVANRDDRRVEDRTTSSYYGGQDYERRCEWVSDGYEERVEGYRVKYEYAGRRYDTVTDTHPGSTIRVRVGVRPENGQRYAYRY